MAISVTYSRGLNVTTTPCIFIEFVYNCVLNAAKICLEAVNKGPMATFNSCVSTAFLISIGKVTKESKFQTTTNCYIPNQTLANKVATFQFLMKSVVKNRKHHNKCLLFEINMQSSQVHNVTPTLCSDISFYYEMKLIRQAMVKNSY